MGINERRLVGFSRGAGDRSRYLRVLRTHPAMKALLTALSVVFAGFLWSCFEQDDGQVTILVHNVTLLDGRGGSALTDAFVEIAADRIIAVGQGTPGPRRGQVRIDGNGGWLLPGFVDMHAHLMMPRCEPGQAVAGFDGPLSEAALGVMLDFGVTTVRSPATPTVEGLALRDALNEGRVRGPRAFAAAELINNPRASPEEIREIVRSALPYRPDFFKAYAGLGPEAVAALVEEAHLHGIPVIGHLQMTSWQEGLDIGIDQLTHAVDWSAAMLPEAERERYNEARLRGRGFASRIDWLEALDLEDSAVTRLISDLVRLRTPVDPTLVAYASKFTPPDMPQFRENPYLPFVPDLHQSWLTCSPDPSGGWTQQDYARWGQAWPKLLELVRAYHEAGVLLTTGSDYTNPWLIPGESLHQEFELLAEAGIPNAAILAMTGANAAEALGTGEIGIVETGRRADIILLSQDPLVDIRHTRAISWVMQGGQIVSYGPPSTAAEERQ